MSNETSAQTVRPTKKQRDILTYIEQFIGQHGYSPSYREIMNGLNYTSVATVSLHVNSLIRRGHLRKRDRSARSLEVVAPSDASKVTTNSIQPAEEKWLIEKVEHLFGQLEQAAEVTENAASELSILVGALRVLELEGAANSFLPRLSALKERVVPDAQVGS